MGASFVHSAVGWVEARAMCFRTDPEHCADTHQRQNNAIAAFNAILRGGMPARARRYSLVFHLLFHI